MVIALVISGALTVAFSIAILFGIGDINLALETPTRYPIIQIFLTATGSRRATTAIICTLISTLIFSTFGTLACASRLAWAFARDKGFPFPNYFAHVSTSSFALLCFALEAMIKPLTLLSGKQALQNSCSCDNPHHHHCLPSWPREHWLIYGIQCSDFLGTDRSLYLLSSSYRSYGHSSIRRKGDTLGTLDFGSLGPSDQSSLHRLLHCLDCLHVVPAIPASHNGEHELRKFDLRRRDSCMHYSLVRIREEGILGSGERGH